MNAIKDPQNIILFLACIATFMAIMGFGMPYFQRDPLQSRLKAVAKRREELSMAQREKLLQAKRPVLAMSKSQVGLMEMILKRLNLQNLVGSQEIRNKLAQAGMRGQAPIVTFAFIRLLVAPIVMALIAVFFLFGLTIEMLDYETNTKVMIVAGATVFGFFLPNMILANMVQKRQLILSRSFPDALDLLVICVEAGLGLEAAFARVSEELAEGSPVLAEELGLTVAELAYLGDRRLALENLADRTGLDSVKSLTTALIQAEKYGTPMSLALKVISQEGRDARMSKAEEKANKLPAQLTVPMIIFFLPVIFVIVLGPSVIKVLRLY